MGFSPYITDGKLTIHYRGDPVLTTVCTPFQPDEFGEELENFGLLMLETIKGAITTNNEKQPGRGIGLAAPQVGLTRCLAVMIRKDNNLPPIIAVNPEITFSYGVPIAHEEGCLSVPEVYSQVSRPAHIRMRYQHPRTAKFIEVTLGGGDGDAYDAFCAAHELDHLQGIEFFDRSRVSRQVSRDAQRRWGKVKNKYVKEMVLA